MGHSGRQPLDHLRVTTRRPIGVSRGTVLAGTAWLRLTHDQTGGLLVQATRRSSLRSGSRPVTSPGRDSLGHLRCQGFDVSPEFRAG